MIVLWKRIGPDGMNIPSKVESKAHGDLAWLEITNVEDPNAVCPLGMR
jgi:hypothetical protein